MAAKEAEMLLKQISESTAIAEKEKQKVAVIVDQVRARNSAHSTVTAHAYTRTLARVGPSGKIGIIGWEKWVLWDVHAWSDHSAKHVTINAGRLG